MRRGRPRLAARPQKTNYKPSTSPEACKVTGLIRPHSGGCWADTAGPGTRGGAACPGSPRGSPHRPARMRTCSWLRRLGRGSQWSGLAVGGRTRACPCSLEGRCTEGTARPWCRDYRQLKPPPRGALPNLRLQLGVSAEGPQAPGWGPDAHRLRRCQGSGPSWPVCPPCWPAPVTHPTQQTAPEPHTHACDRKWHAAGTRP